LGTYLPITTANASAQTNPRTCAWRRILSFPAVLTLALVYFVFLLARRDIPDPDLWWHLRNVQLLIHGHLPAADIYSYTAAGATVLPFEWLSELPFYAAFRWAGLTGLYWLVFALCTGIVLGIFRLCYLASGDVKNSFVVSVGGAVLAAINIGSRPLLFGWLYMVALLLILAAVRRGGWRWLWLLPALFCLWINSHGSWPMGMAVLAIFVASGLVEGRWGQACATQWSAPELYKLLAAAAASVAALFVNPTGYRLVFYAFQAMFGTHSSVGSVDEFASVDFHTPWGKVAMVLILGTLASAIFSRVLWRLDEIALTMLALYAALTYSRFLFLAAILLPPIFAQRIKLMTPYERESDKPLPNAVALAILLLLFVVSLPRKFEAPVHYPAGAVAYMKSHAIQGRLFHDYVWGGYLIWHLPETKVFIDGRWDPYAARGVPNDYAAVISGERSQAVLDKYGVEYVLMPPDSRLVELLKNTPRWEVRYSDSDSVLLQRSATL
jgi:hypothetical protein